MQLVGRAVVLFAALGFGLVGCGECDPTLVRDGGGSLVDGGVDRPDDAGTLMRDGGGLDGGDIVEAGPLDEECGVNLASPPQCEEDADFCRDEESQGELPEILAGWSSLDGGDIVFQLMFNRHPFQRPTTTHAFTTSLLQVLLDGPIVGIEMSGVGVGPTGATLISLQEVATDRVYFLDDGGPIADVATGVAWPPDFLAVFDQSATATAPATPFRVVDHVKLGRRYPILEVRLPVEAVTTIDAVPDWTASVISTDIWAGGSETRAQVVSSQFVASMGGTSDVSEDLVQSNNIRCPGVEVPSLACEVEGGRSCQLGGLARCESGSWVFEEACDELEAAVCEESGEGAQCVFLAWQEQYRVAAEIDPVEWSALNDADRSFAACFSLSDSAICGASEGDQGQPGCSLFSGCTDSAPTCNGDEEAPFCIGTSLVIECRGNGQAVFVDCSSTQIGGTGCMEGSCTGVEVGGVCDDSWFFCKEGAWCNAGDLGGLGRCFSDGGP